MSLIAAALLIVLAPFAGAAGSPDPERAREWEALAQDAKSHSLRSPRFGLKEYEAEFEKLAARCDDLRALNEQKPSGLPAEDCVLELLDRLIEERERRPKAPSVIIPWRISRDGFPCFWKPEQLKKLKTLDNGTTRFALIDFDGKPIRLVTLPSENGAAPRTAILAPPTRDALELDGAAFDGQRRRVGRAQPQLAGAVPNLPIAGHAAAPPTMRPGAAERSPAAAGSDRPDREHPLTITADEDGVLERAGRAALGNFVGAGKGVEQSARLGEAWLASRRKAYGALLTYFDRLERSGLDRPQEREAAQDARRILDSSDPRAALQALDALESRAPELARRLAEFQASAQAAESAEAELAAKLAGDPALAERLAKRQQDSAARGRELEAPDASLDRRWRSITKLFAGENAPALSELGRLHAAANGGEAAADLPTLLRWASANSETPEVAAALKKMRASSRELKGSMDELIGELDQAVSARYANSAQVRRFLQGSKSQRQAMIMELSLGLYHREFALLARAVGKLGAAASLDADEKRALNAVFGEQIELAKSDPGKLRELGAEYARRSRTIGLLLENAEAQASDGLEKMFREALRAAGHDLLDPDEIRRDPAATLRYLVLNRQDGLDRLSRRAAEAAQKDERAALLEAGLGKQVEALEKARARFEAALESGFMGWRSLAPELGAALAVDRVAGLRYQRHNAAHLKEILQAGFKGDPRELGFGAQAYDVRNAYALGPEGGTEGAEVSLRLPGGAAMRQFRSYDGKTMTWTSLGEDGEPAKTLSLRGLADPSLSRGLYKSLSVGGKLIIDGRVYTKLEDDQRALFAGEAESGDNARFKGSFVFDEKSLSMRWSDGTLERKGRPSSVFKGGKLVGKRDLDGTEYTAETVRVAHPIEKDRTVEIEALYRLRGGRKIYSPFRITREGAPAAPNAEESYSYVTPGGELRTDPQQLFLRATHGSAPSYLKQTYSGIESRLPASDKPILIEVDYRSGGRKIVFGDKTGISQVHSFVGGKLEEISLPRADYTESFFDGHEIELAFHRFANTRDGGAEYATLLPSFSKEEQKDAGDILCHVRYTAEKETNWPTYPARAHATLTLLDKNGRIKAKRNSVNLRIDFWRDGKLQIPLDLGSPGAEIVSRRLREWWIATFSPEGDKTWETIVARSQGIAAVVETASKVPLGLAEAVAGISVMSHSYTYVAAASLLADGDLGASHATFQQGFDILMNNPLSRTYNEAIYGTATMAGLDRALNESRGIVVNAEGELEAVSGLGAIQLDRLRAAAEESGARVGEALQAADESGLQSQLALGSYLNYNFVLAKKETGATRVLLDATGAAGLAGKTVLDMAFFGQFMAPISAEIGGLARAAGMVENSAVRTLALSGAKGVELGYRGAEFAFMRAPFLAGFGEEILFNPKGDPWDIRLAKTVGNLGGIVASQAGQRIPELRAKRAAYEKVFTPEYFKTEPGKKLLSETSVTRFLLSATAKEGVAFAGAGLAAHALEQAGVDKQSAAFLGLLAFQVGEAGAAELAAEIKAGLEAKKPGPKSKADAPLPLKVVRSEPREVAALIGAGRNPSWAMEKVVGVTLEQLFEMDPKAAGALVTRETLRQAREGIKALRAKGLGGGDSPQVMILTAEQTIAGVRRKPGDVVFVDAETLGGKDPAGWKTPESIVNEILKSMPEGARDPRLPSDRVAAAPGRAQRAKWAIDDSIAAVKKAFLRATGKGFTDSATLPRSPGAEADAAFRGPRAEARAPLEPGRQRGPPSEAEKSVDAARKVALELNRRIAAKGTDAKTLGLDELFEQLEDGRAIDADAAPEQIAPFLKERFGLDALPEIKEPKKGDEEAKSGARVLSFKDPATGDSYFVKILKGPRAASTMLFELAGIQGFARNLPSGSRIVEPAGVFRIGGDGKQVLYVMRAAGGKAVYDLLKGVAEAPLGSDARERSFAEAEQAVAAVARTIGETHEKGADYEGFDGKLAPERKDYADKTLARLEALKASGAVGEELYAALKAELERGVQAYADSELAGGFIHGDGHGGNFFVEPSGKVTVIDVDTAFWSLRKSGHPAEDIGRLVESIQVRNILKKLGLTPAEVLALQEAALKAYGEAFSGAQSQDARSAIAFNRARLRMVALEFAAKGVEDVANPPEGELKTLREGLAEAYRRETGAPAPPARPRAARVQPAEAPGSPGGVGAPYRLLKAAAASMRGWRDLIEDALGLPSSKKEMRRVEDRALEALHARSKRHKDALRAEERERGAVTTDMLVVGGGIHSANFVAHFESAGARARVIVAEQGEVASAVFGALSKSEAHTADPATLRGKGEPDNDMFGALPEANLKRLAEAVSPGQADPNAAVYSLQTTALLHNSNAKVLMKTKVVALELFDPKASYGGAEAWAAKDYPVRAKIVDLETKETRYVYAKTVFEATGAAAQAKVPIGKLDANGRPVESAEARERALRLLDAQDAGANHDPGTGVPAVQEVTRAINRFSSTQRAQEAASKAGQPRVSNGYGKKVVTVIGGGQSAMIFIDGLLSVENAGDAPSKIIWIQRSGFRTGTKETIEKAREKHKVEVEFVTGATASDIRQEGGRLVLPTDQRGAPGPTFETDLLVFASGGEHPEMLTGSKDGLLPPGYAYVNVEGSVPQLRGRTKLARQLARVDANGEPIRGENGEPEVLPIFVGGHAANLIDPLNLARVATPNERGEVQFLPDGPGQLPSEREAALSDNTGRDAIANKQYRGEALARQLASELAPKPPAGTKPAPAISGLGTAVQAKFEVDASRAPPRRAQHPSVHALEARIELLGLLDGAALEKNRSALVTVKAEGERLTVTLEGVPPKAAESLRAALDASPQAQAALREFARSQSGAAGFSLRALEDGSVDRRGVGFWTSPAPLVERIRAASVSGVDGSPAELAELIPKKPFSSEAGKRVAEIKRHYEEVLRRRGDAVPPGELAVEPPMVDAESGAYSFEIRRGGKVEALFTVYPETEGGHRGAISSLLSGKALAKAGFPAGEPLDILRAVYNARGASRIAVLSRPVEGVPLAERLRGLTWEADLRAAAGALGALHGAATPSRKLFESRYEAATAGVGPLARELAVPSGAVPADWIVPAHGEAHAGNIRIGKNGKAVFSGPSRVAENSVIDGESLRGAGHAGQDLARLILSAAETRKAAFGSREFFDTQRAVLEGYAKARGLDPTSFADALPFWYSWWQANAGRGFAEARENAPFAPIEKRLERR